MKQKLVHLAGVALWLFTMSAMGQSPINDTLVVRFPTAVQVGSQTLSAGEYTIRQLSSASNSRLLEFSTDKGTSIQASATSIPALDNNNRNDSSVIVVERGGVSQVHKIWVKGKSYGYEFPVSKDSVTTTAARSDGMRLTATYSAPPMAVATLGKEVQPEVAVEAPAAAVVAVVATPVQAPAPAEVRVTETAPIAPETQVAATDANATQNTPEMPKTSLHWMTLLVSGLGIMSFGWVALTLIRRA